MADFGGISGILWNCLRISQVRRRPLRLFLGIWRGGERILPRDSSKGFFHGILSEDSHQLDDAHGNDSAVHGVPALRDRAVNVDVDALIHRSFINKTKPNKND